MLTIEIDIRHYLCSPQEINLIIYHEEPGHKEGTPLFSSLFICLLHIPFVFAKAKPKQFATTGTVSKPVLMKDSVDASSLLTENNFRSGIYDSLKLSSLGLARQVFDYAMKGFEYLKETGKLNNQNIISIVDFSKSSCKKRLYIIDLKNYKVVFNTYVAHGMNSGQEYAHQFSNIPESNKSSLGFYQTADTYMGKNGYSLHLQGMEKGINDNASRRDIVIHGADYVNENLIHARGYIGRSQGCPAVPERFHKQIIDKIKNGTCLFIFGEDRSYFLRSAMIKSADPLLAYN
ncbi:MAG: murein L,D-transpeptidase catalytic domain family protein [Chitinophagaceae bacterium]|nr:murein L,D-transpeptidase catalytic domain family protein [Chitinophagaceae bacterium]